MSDIRIGIDVGGTFTHAVAIDGASMEIVGRSLVPTTHFSKKGVAEGIILSLKKLLEQYPDPSKIKFIAHSTTQATNALLEGDVAEVAVIKTKEDFNGLNKNNFGAVVASRAFSVDDPSGEDLLVKEAASLNLPAIATHEISGLYGLKARTRTAVINASILPKMLEAAAMTEESVKKSGVNAGLMVMRSDGGVMSLADVRRRPILTILSGPAAGVAAALMYERISNGIFIEVGGTSTDITAIKNGKAIIKTAVVDNKRLYLKTLDVRTIGVAGGSMIRAGKESITHVGPRSAHIAGLKYSCFCDAEKLEHAGIKKFSPKTGDPNDYISLECKDGSQVAVTITCAANALQLIPKNDYAFGKAESARKAISIIAESIGKTTDEVCYEILDVAAEKFKGIIFDLSKQYGFEKDEVVLVGGGGGASAIVPYVAKRMNLESRIAKNNEILSAIGVALAMLHETVERTVINPDEQDVLRIRQEAFDKLLKMGAKSETIDVNVEVDTKRNILLASGFGAMELKKQDERSDISESKKIDIASKSMRISQENVKLLCKTSGFSIYKGLLEKNKFFGLFKEKLTPVRVIDSAGVIRIQFSSGSCHYCKAGEISEDLKNVLHANLRFGDAGLEITKVFLVFGSKIVDLSGLTDIKQMASLIKIELQGIDDNQLVAIVFLKT